MTRRMLLLVLTVFLRSVWPSGADEFVLTVLHNNDFHSHFQQTDVNTGVCSKEDEASHDCYGGFARLVSKVEELRNSSRNAVLLYGGDYFQGTSLYSVDKWRVVADFVNRLKYDAMSLGNHEFDDGVAGLVPYLQNISWPVVVSNMDASGEPSMQGLYTKSVTIRVGGKEIAIIGYLTPDTQTVSNPGKKLKFSDEITSIKAEVARLQTMGVKIIIALGHSGYLKDQEIGKIDGVDLVVGGHSHTFLYSGDPPSNDAPEGPYPTVVTQSSGRKVPVVQAYCYGKYLGRLEVAFNEKGEVVRWKGQPILLDKTVLQDPSILEALQPWLDTVAVYANKTVGTTNVFLDGQRNHCRREECNLGNLLADSLVFSNLREPTPSFWNHVSLGIVNGGGIRSSIDKVESGGKITMEDLMSVAPFSNTIDLVSLRGSDVRQMFEHSVSKYDEKAGQFLQVSGFRVVYNIGRAINRRVVSVEVLCNHCQVPRFEPLEDQRVYNIVMPTFLVNGGDGYSVIDKNKITHIDLGMLDLDVYSSYITKFSPIIQGLEGRITFTTGAAVSHLASILVIFTSLLVTSLICSLIGCKL